MENREPLANNTENQEPCTKQDGKSKFLHRVRWKIQRQDLYLHLWPVIASCFQLFLFVRLTCSVLPLDSRVCVLSGLKSRPSLNQLILGVGLPSTWHSSSVDLFTNTVTSSGMSLSAPRIEGGTVRRHTHTHTHITVTKWMLTANKQRASTCCYILFLRDHTYTRL